MTEHEHQIEQRNESEQLHARLVRRFPGVAESRYGRNVSEAAWWALAAEHVMQGFQDDYDDSEVDGRIAMIASGHEAIEPLVKQHLHFVPAEVIAHLTLDGEPFALDAAIEGADYSDHALASRVAGELRIGWASNLAMFDEASFVNVDELIGEIKALTESKYVTDEGKRLATWLGHYVVANTNEEGDLSRGEL